MSPSLKQTTKNSTYFATKVTKQVILPFCHSVKRNKLEGLSKAIYLLPSLILTRFIGLPLLCDTLGASMGKLKHYTQRLDMPENTLSYEE